MYSRLRLTVALAALFLGGYCRLSGQTFLQYNQYDPIGVNTVRDFDPTITGSGQTVAQVEGDFGAAGAFEVNPSNPAITQPASKFTYISSNGTVTGTFPNAAGTESGHADSVAGNMYGLNAGTAYGVSTIYNYDASYFFDNVVATLTSISAKVVNQSFAFTNSDGSNLSPADQAEVDQDYDNYAARYGTLFISAVGDGGPIFAPGSAYNGIGVGAVVGTASGSTSTGPAYDGLSKPDITAEGGITSYSTPYVTGAALLLEQTGARGDGGAGTASAATDPRTIKALLMNGADKPPSLIGTTMTETDSTYGTGILNIYNSYMNLRSGEYAASASLSGSIHSVTSATYRPDEGWDLATLTNAGNAGSYIDKSNHYSFNLSSSVDPEFTLSATLDWFIGENETSINNLFLYLYDEDTGSLVDVADSTSNNVQYLYIPDLAPGHYDLAVLKSGSSVVTSSETYALAYDFAPVPEPSPSWLLLPGLALLLIRCRKPTGAARP